MSFFVLCKSNNKHDHTTPLLPQQQQQNSVRLSSMQNPLITWKLSDVQGSRIPGFGFKRTGSLFPQNK